MKSADDIALEVERERDRLQLVVVDAREQIALLSAQLEQDAASLAKVERLHKALGPPRWVRTTHGSVRLNVTTGGAPAVIPGAVPRYVNQGGAR